MNTSTSLLNPKYLNVNEKTDPRDQEIEQLTIIIEQGKIVGFNQNKIYPNLEGINGDGI